MADVATLSVLLIARDKLSGVLQKNQKGLRAVGVAAAAMGAVLLGTAALSVKAALDFESSFAGVRKTVDATEAQFAELAQGFRELAKEIPVNVNELNRIGEAAGQLGIKRENIIAFTETIAKLGVTTNLTGEQAATQLARIANITGLAQTEFDRMGSAIVELGNNLATTEAEITTFTLRIAGAGKIAGLTETQMLAIGGAMTSVGIQAEAGGTAVQKALIAMNQAVIEGNAELGVFAETAGLSAREFAKAWEQDAGAAFTLFVEGLGKAGDNAVNILGQVDLTDQRLVRSFLSLANAGELLRDSMKLSNDAFQDNSALTKEAEERFKTFASQLTLAKNQVTDVAITLGQILIPIIQSVLKHILPIIEGIGRWASEHEELTTILTVAGVAVGALSLAFGSFLLILPSLAAGIALIATVSLPLTILPLTIAAAITALVVVFVKWDDMSRKLQITLLAVGTVLTGGLLPAALLISKNWKTIWEGMRKITETVVNKIVDGINLVMRKIGDWIIKTKELLDAIPGRNPFGNALAEAAEALQNVVGHIDLTTQATNTLMVASGELANAAIRASDIQIEAGNKSLESTVERVASEKGLLADLAVTRANISQENIFNVQAANDAIFEGTRQRIAALNAAEQEGADTRLAIASASLSSLESLANAHNQRLRNAAIAAASGVTQISGNVPVTIQVPPGAAQKFLKKQPRQTTLGGELVTIHGGLTPPGLDTSTVVQNHITVEIDGQALETKIVRTVVDTKDAGGFEGVFDEG